MNIRWACVLILSSLTGCAMKSTFDARMTGDGTYWVLTNPLIYEDPETKETFIVPRGFVTDLASVPRLFWSAFPPCGRYTPPAVVHDYLYWEQPAECKKDCADNVLLHAMKEAGVPSVTRGTIYQGVVKFGGIAYERNAKAKAKGQIHNIPEDCMNFGPNETWDVIEQRIKSGSCTPSKTVSNDPLTTPTPEPQRLLVAACQK